jgi:amino acid adenylation domain-containing protein
MFEDGLGAALLAAAKRHAERDALWALDETLTYRALFERAASVANGLHRNGVMAGQRVAILSHRSATAYVGVLGALLAGCTYVPLNTRFPSERNGSILRQSDAAAIVLDHRCAMESDNFIGEIDANCLVLTPESPHRIEAWGGRQLTDCDLPQPQLAGVEAVPCVSPDQACYLLFTSGTTGAPKGVPISHANLGAYLPAIQELVQLGPMDRVLQCVDLTFDLSVHDMFLTWLNGAALYSAPENGSIFAPRLIARHRLTASLLVPSTGSLAVREGLVTPGCMPTLRYGLFAGEALPVSMVRSWQEAAPDSVIYNLYGPTEGTIHVSWYRINPGQPLPMSVVPIGWPVGKQRMELFDGGRQVAPGETGEIYLTGPQMTAGYWRSPALDAEKFVMIDGTRWYRTGDLGRHVEPNGVQFVGRADRQVKIRGYRVELQEVEGVLRNACGCGQVAVLAWPVTADGNAEGCVAFIAGPAQDIGAVKRSCRNALPSYMVPSDIYFVDQLPLNANGKTDYRMLQKHTLLCVSDDATAHGKPPLEQPSATVAEVTRT